MTKQSIPPRTDAGNAANFAALNKQRVRFDYRQKRWLLWGKHWWVEDMKREVYGRVISAARYRQQVLALRAKDGDELKKEVKWGIDSENLQRIEACLKLAACDERLAE